MAKTNNFSIKFIQAVEKVLEENRLRLGSVKEEEILGDSWRKEMSEIDDQEELQKITNKLANIVFGKVYENFKNTKSELINADVAKEEILEIWYDYDEEPKEQLTNLVELKKTLFEHQQQIKNWKSYEINEIEEKINNLEEWKNNKFETWKEYNHLGQDRADEIFLSWLVLKGLKEHQLKNYLYLENKGESDKTTSLVISIIEETDLEKLREIKTDGEYDEKIFPNLSSKLKLLKEIREEQLSTFKTFKDEFEQKEPSGLSDKEIEEWMLSELVKDGKKAREFFDNAVTTSDRVEQINLTELEIAELQAQITEKEENIKITQQKLANQIARDSWETDEVLRNRIQQNQVEIDQINQELEETIYAVSLPVLYISDNSIIQKKLLSCPLVFLKQFKFANNLLKDINSKKSSIALPENYLEKEIKSLAGVQLPEELEQRSILDFIKFKRDYLKKNEKEFINNFKNTVDEVVILEDSQILAYLKYSPSGDHWINGRQAGIIFNNGWKDPDSFWITNLGEIRGVGMASKYDPLLKKWEETLEEIWISYFQGEEPTDLEKEQILEYLKDFDVSFFDLKTNAENSRSVYEKGWKGNQFEWKGSSLLLSYESIEETPFDDIQTENDIEERKSLKSENEEFEEIEDGGEDEKEEEVKSSEDLYSIISESGAESNSEKESFELIGESDEDSVETYVEYEEDKDEQKHFALKQISLINSKPKELSPNEQEKKKLLKKSLADLDNQLKEISENPFLNPEKKSAQSQPILEKSHELQNQLIELNSKIFNSKDQLLLKHYQRVLNFNPLGNDQIIEIEGKQIQLTYQGNQSFAEWEANIDKNEVNILIIKGGSRLENNQLIIWDYPNLKELYAHNCSLEEVEINAPQLEILNLHGNSLQKLDCDNITGLKNLTISKNKSLQQIIGFEKLTNLKELTCFECRLGKIDCSNKIELFKLAVANQFTNYLELNIQGCDKLTILDCAENNICELNCSNLTNLKDVSFKENFAHFANINYFFFNFIDENIAPLWGEKEIVLSKKKWIELSESFFDYQYNNSNKKRYSKEWKKQFKDLLINQGKITNFSREEIELIVYDNLFKIDANFSGCTSLEKLNFSKSNIASLNVDNTPNLKEVIGGWMNTVNDDKDFSEQHMLYTEPVEGGCFVEKFEDSEAESDQEELEEDRNTSEISEQDNNETNDIDEEEWETESDNRSAATEEKESESDWENGWTDDEESDIEDKKTSKYYLTHNQYKELLKQIEKDSTLLKNYRTVVKTKLVKPTRDYDAEPWYNTAFWEDKSKFPNLVSLHLDNEKANIYDDPEYGERIVRLQVEQEARELGVDPNVTPKPEEEQNITDPNQLTDSIFNHNLNQKYRNESKDVAIAGGAGIYFTGTVIIDDWQTEDINIGNNHLSYLVVRNCQNLRKLRYAHNSLLHDAWIDWATCPNLTPENVDKHNWDGKLYGWNSCYDNQLDSDDKSTGNEKFIEKLQKQSDLTQQITTILTQGEANANLTQLLNLLEEIKLLQSAEPELYQSLNKEDLGKVIIFFNNHLETEVKSLITKYQTHQISLPSFKTQLEPFKNYLAALSPETIKQLQTILNSQTQSTTQLTPPQVKLWPWVVGGILATPLFLLLVYSLAKKIVTADLNKQTSPQDHKVR